MTSRNVLLPNNPQECVALLISIWHINSRRIIGIINNVTSEFILCIDVVIVTCWNQNPGWGAIRKWPLIRPSPTHTVCSQTKITGSGIWFECTIVWSEITSVWGWHDQRSLRSGDGMIRGHFGLGMVWSEVISVWGWYAQRSLQDGNGLIREGFKRTLVWSETIASGILFDFFVLFYRAMLAQPRGNKKQHYEHRHIWSLMSLVRTKGLQLIEHASPLTVKLCLTVEDELLCGKLSEFIHWVRNVH